MNSAELVDSDAPAEADNAARLEPKLDPRWALGWPEMLMVAGAAALYLVVSYFPLTDPAVWNAVNYGDWIREHRRLPASDWIMPYSEAMRVVDTQWATEVLLATVASWGDNWLTTFAGLLVAATFVICGRAYWLLSRRSAVTLLVTLAVVAMAWPRYTTLRPEHLGILCLACVLWWGASLRATAVESGLPNRWSPARFVALAAIFCAWANLHSSVVWGLVILACWLAGTWIDAWRREGRFVAALGDRDVQGYTFALELAVIATCLNPHGVDLLLEIVWFAPQKNLLELPEWQPLVLLRSAGPAFALSVVALLAIARLSRASLASADVLALAATAIATILHQRYIAFYAPVFGFLLASHLAGLAQRWLPRTAGPSESMVYDQATGEVHLPAGRAWAYSLLALLSVWIAFSLSDASRPLLGGKARTPEQLYGPTAPLGLLAYLEKQPPRETVFVPAGWGDWLYRQSEGRWLPFATSRVEALPRQVWTDYNSIASSQSGWRNVLRRYRVNTMVVDRQQQPALVTGLRLDPEWKPVFQDTVGMVFTTGDSGSNPTVSQEESYD